MYDEIRKRLERFNSWRSPSWLRFADEGDGSGGGVGGGDPRKIEAPPEGDQKPPEGDQKPPLAEDKITVKVDGREKIYSREEAKKALEKVGGADARFQEAADLKKQAERGMRIDSLFARVQEGKANQQELSELAGLMNIDPAIFEGTPPDEEPSKKGDPPRKVAFEDLPDDIQEDLKVTRERNIAYAKERIKGEVKKAVDKDDIIGKMNSVAKEAGNEEFMATVVDSVYEDVLRKIRSGIQHGPAEVLSSIQEERARLKRYGIPDKSAKQPALIMGLGKTDGLPVEIDTQEPVERLESTDKGYEDNLVRRFFHGIAKSRQSAKA
jgi:hypothetical protein